jgi:hypothetical protein
MKNFVFIFYFGMISAISSLSNTINVPADYLKIQDAIKHSVNGDTILVAPGIYYENLNFMGRNVVLTSNYVFDQDTAFIKNTIINGSQPSNTDTASCILIVSGEDSSAVVQGFTITGGSGTKWPDIEFGNTLFREGGGILIDFSSPTIKHNCIIENIVNNGTGVNSYGGGAIRVHKGNPLILNNLIVGNSGNYGGAIVLYYSGGVFRNNIILGNTAGSAYGGSTIWISQGFNKTVKFDNNTIAGNISMGEGGGMRINATSAKLENNLVWGNIQVSKSQLVNINPGDCSYNDVEDGISGVTNNSLFPEFLDSNLLLSNISPCIDNGDTSLVFHDAEDGASPGMAKFPSMGGLRNDIGSYGGPYGSIFPFFQFSRIGVIPSVSFGNTDSVDTPTMRKISLINQSTDKRIISSVEVMRNKEDTKVLYFPGDSLKPLQSDSIMVVWTPTDDQQYFDTLLIYHNARNSVNPLRIPISGKARIVTGIINFDTKKNVRNYPNPFVTSTVIRYPNNIRNGRLIVFDTKGIPVRSVSLNQTDEEYTFQRDDLQAGIYFYQIIDGNEVLAGKMAIVN